MSVFIAQGEGRSRDTPADLRIGWEKGGVLRINLLVGWEQIRPLWAGGRGVGAQ